ncbi:MULTISPECIES: fumarylacetoacetate hydrolase family protein [unclassified Mycobacterium]|uniref:fumarylacetoacetate hydrolase family protein n=1 Tax=unclassified Mycobacterium TaxID=2642494 RepID=UPI00048C1D33|nr:MULTISPECIES: fumarylacetoacetate hydrolase family protein [unclassified Mycobacterium]SEB26086.1 2-keto-4-pentenoate hydratase/2-oxohepta-3-ene-1,7-dioic acid hydratase (catechol pathway) [Mycobacterium sp. 283mftsu]
MRLYTTDRGIGREDRAGTLGLLNLPYRDLGELLAGPGLAAARAASVTEEVELAEATLLAPIIRPGKILIVGLNYPSHAKEALQAFAAMGRGDIALPTEPNMQLIAGSATIGTSDEIKLPAVAPLEIDYEGELAVVIGKTAASIPADRAWDHLAGLTIVNDVGARDIQIRAMTGDPVASIGVAKSFDTFKPLGPCLVTADEFQDGVDLRLQTRVNGEVRQDDRTSSLIFPIADLVAHFSKHQTLQPGDVICTGTPSGAGFFTGRYLRPGDEVEVSIERIGVLRNRVSAA